MRAPDYIGDESLGQTPSTNISSVLGRSFKMSLMDITNRFDDLNYGLKFRVTGITGNRASTEFVGQELNRDFKRSQIRNHRSQVEGIFNLTLKDGSRLRITAFAVTFNRAAHNTKKEIRKAIRETLFEYVEDITFPALVNSLVNYELRSLLYEPANDVFPIKILEISKVKVLRLPEDRRAMDADDLEIDEDVDLSQPSDMDEEDEEIEEIEAAVEETEEEGSEDDEEEDE